MASLAVNGLNNVKLIMMCSNEMQEIYCVVSMMLACSTLWLVIFRGFKILWILWLSMKLLEF